MYNHECNLPEGFVIENTKNNNNENEEMETKSSPRKTSSKRLSQSNSNNCSNNNTNNSNTNDRPQSIQEYYINYSPGTTYPFLPIIPTHQPRPYPGFLNYGTSSPASSSAATTMDIAFLR